MQNNKIPRSDKTLLIACGALARELLALIEVNNFDHMDITCIPASIHNTPKDIPEAMRAKIREHRDDYGRIVALFADCGTGGMLDVVLAEEGVERIHGAHCYEFYTGPSAFAELAEQELGTFYLTDFLAQHFDRLVVRPLKLDSHPELRDAYFGNYRRLIYLSQRIDEDLLRAAKVAADRLMLEFEHVHCGYGELETSLRMQLEGRNGGQENNHLLA